MSDSWTVEDVRSSHVVYCEGDHKAWIPGEILSGGYQQADFVLYPKSPLSWKPPYTSEPINQDKKEEIIKRTCENLKTKGLKVEVSW